MLEIKKSESLFFPTKKFFSEHLMSVDNEKGSWQPIDISNVEAESNFFYHRATIQLTLVTL